MGGWRFAVVCLVAVSVLPERLGAQTQVGDPWGLQFVKLAGVLDPGMPDPSISYDGASLSYGIAAAGHDIGDAQDGCAFAFSPFHGDFSVVARVDQELGGPATDPCSKAGLMVRGSLTAEAKMVFYGASRFCGDALMIWREADGADSDWPGVPDEQGGLDPPFFLRLDRRGDAFTGAYSRDGRHWTEGSTHVNPAFTDPVYVGLAVSSAEETNETTMLFSQFTLDRCPPAVAWLEDFEDGVADGFLAGAGSWAVTNGAYLQSASGGGDSLDWYAWSWVPAGLLSNYTVEAEITPLSSAAASVVYAHGDSGADYRADFWDGGSRLCIPALGGIWTSRYVVANDGLALATGQVYAAKVEVSEAGVTVWLDGLLRHSETWADGVPLGDGNVGLGAWNRACFDDVVVRLGSEQGQIRPLSSTMTGLSLRVALPRMNLLPVTLADGNRYAVADISGTTLGEIGKPAVPVLTAWVLVPNGTVPELQVQTGEEVFWENIRLAPVQPPRADADGAPLPPFTRDEATYSMDTNWPGVWAELGPVERLRGHPCALLRIYPYQYNPVRRRLTAVADLDVNVLFHGIPEGVESRLKSDASDWTLWNMAVNDDPVLQIPDIESVLVTNWGYDYLIFTTPAMKPAADELAAWKTKCGFG